MALFAPQIFDTLLQYFALMAYVKLVTLVGDNFDLRNVICRIFIEVHYMKLHSEFGSPRLYGF